MTILHNSKVLKGLVYLAIIWMLSSCAPRPRIGSGKWVEVGIASWYGKKFHGKRTASGEVFDMYKLTAAHRLLPFGTRVKVKNLENGKEVIVRINDRGPNKRGRIIDLSYASAKRIGMIEKGLVKVRLEVIKWGKP